MDPMTEMFCDESNVILHDMRRNLLAKKEQEYYEQDVVQEIFRSVHTLKADSAMMLYENMAQVSKELEGLLYCFRGNGKIVSDTKRFDDVVCDYLDFFEQEIDKIVEGFVPDGTIPELEKKIKAYTLEMTSQMEELEREKYHSEISKPKKQIFYIASASEENVASDISDIKETVDQEEISKKSNEKQKKKYFISQGERNRICQSARTLLRVIDSLEYSLGKDECGTFSREQFLKLQTVQRDLEFVKKGLANTDFVPVAKKMEIVVDEMSAKLGKPAKLLVKGEHTPVDFEKREKISSALIHVIRNAVDHGIETPEVRERYGKSPMGLIKLKFSTEDGRLKISVSDDGAGIDTKRVLEKARQQGVLTKLPEEYTKEEIIDLILISGITSLSEANEYSGRGVGMDVISHNVKAVGGKLKITSESGIGTKIVMKF